MVLKQSNNRHNGDGFENDVKTYGTETRQPQRSCRIQFENDVKTYGTETQWVVTYQEMLFENDVKTYGTETV